VKRKRLVTAVERGSAAGPIDDLTGGVGLPLANLGHRCLQ